MDISTSDLAHIAREIRALGDFLEPFAYAIGTATWNSVDMPFDDFVSDIARMAEALEKELAARQTPNKLPSELPTEEALRTMIREEVERYANAHGRVVVSPQENESSSGTLP